VLQQPPWRNHKDRCQPPLHPPTCRVQVVAGVARGVAHHEEGLGFPWPSWATAVQRCKMPRPCAHGLTEPYRSRPAPGAPMPAPGRTPAPEAGPPRPPGLARGRASTPTPGSPTPAPGRTPAPEAGPPRPPAPTPAAPKPAPGATPAPEVGPPRPPGFGRAQLSRLGMSERVTPQARQNANSWSLLMVPARVWTFVLTRAWPWGGGSVRGPIPG